MPAWFLPALKVALPHLGTILSAAAPVFTKKRGDTPSDQPATLQQQIAELQAAVARNDSHIKDLATQMRTALEALEQGTDLAERRYQRVMTLCLAMGVVTVVSIGLALRLLLR